MTMSAERPMSDGGTAHADAAEVSLVAPTTASDELYAGPPADTPLGRVPDFFIVGHAKCGTTALYEMLRCHPQIHMPAKEPRFFAMKQADIDDREDPDARAGVSDSPGKRPRTLAGYMSLFADARADQLVGEATPLYLRSSVAASRIAALRPDARMIAILREPSSFLRSF